MKSSKLINLLDKKKKMLKYIFKSSFEVLKHQMYKFIFILHLINFLNYLL
jgi:hypothetical protein